MKGKRRPAAEVAYRNPADVLAAWEGAAEVDPAELAWESTGEFWDLLAEKQRTLVVTREYEHLILALSVENGAPSLSYLRLPHPSGTAFSADTNRLYVALTRNPNQLFEFAPATGTRLREDVPELPPIEDRPFVPVRSWFFPGSTYLHDLAFCGGKLLGTAVGENAVVRFLPEGGYERVWWPESVDGPEGPRFERNYLQLNSIAAGRTLEESFFTASTDRIGEVHPGDPNFPVDRRGVVFSGKTRGPIVRGLTRPHSARLHSGRLWLDNSGYGEVGYVDGESFVAVQKLPGWTRGLSFAEELAFVGTSRVLPRFRSYAPGLDPDECVCGIHAIEISSGRVVGSLLFPGGNQIFSVEAIPARVSRGFPFRADPVYRDRKTALFYAYRSEGTDDG
ncbi:MAG: hypothetical protein KatS3mg076_2182 [Candidatus Binatia bacterium]|nr:MAG: hypothetical protein KatS3mg076_2182 [Candidatus Binatia bacterium]